MPTCESGEVSPPGRGARAALVSGGDEAGDRGGGSRPVGVGHDVERGAAVAVRIRHLGPHGCRSVPSPYVPSIRRNILRGLRRG